LHHEVSNVKRYAVKFKAVDKNAGKVFGVFSKTIKAQNAQKAVISLYPDYSFIRVISIAPVKKEGFVMG